MARGVWHAAGHFLLHVLFEVVLVDGEERELVGLFHANAVGQHQFRESDAVDQHDPPLAVACGRSFGPVQKG